MAQAMEGLAGVNELQNYEFVERRPGGWQAEIDRLEKEQIRHARLAERVKMAHLCDTAQLLVLLHHLRCKLTVHALLAYIFCWGLQSLLCSLSLYDAHRCHSHYTTQAQQFLSRTVADPAVRGAGCTTGCKGCGERQRAAGETTGEAKES